MSRPKRPVDRATSRRPSTESQSAERRPVSGGAPRSNSGTRSRASAVPSRGTGASRSSATARPSRPGNASAMPSRSSGVAGKEPSRPIAGSSRSPSTARAGSSSRPISSGRPSFSSRSSVGHSAARSTTPSKPPSQPPTKRRAPKRKKWRPRWGRWLVLLLLVVLCVKGVPMLVDRFAPEEAASTTVQAVARPLVSDEDKAGFDANINSDSAMIIDVGNGDILYEKDADTPRPPASLVKMMTVYVAIKNCDNVDRELAMPKAAYKGLEANKASQSGLKAGETVTVRDLLYAAMLSSGGDAANALALVTGGNIDAFVEMMNDEAKRMGLDSTVFKNPTGLDAEGQVSTCRDMARLLKGALGNTLFQEVFTTQTYTTTANDVHPNGLALSHTMSKDRNTFQRYFDTSGYEIIGGKTGYTESAGNCLVTLAKKDKSPSFAVVTMHATGTGDQYYQAFHDAVTLYGEAYEQLKEAPVEKNGSLS